MGLPQFPLRLLLPVIRGDRRPATLKSRSPSFVEQGMVEVAGDTITVPARFWSGGQRPAP
jgi:hypothetical protein